MIKHEVTPKISVKTSTFPLVPIFVSHLFLLYQEEENKWYDLLTASFLKASSAAAVFPNHKLCCQQSLPTTYRSLLKLKFQIPTSDFILLFLKTSFLPKIKLRCCLFVLLLRNKRREAFTLSFFKKYDFWFWKEIRSCYHHFMASIDWATIDAVLLNLRKFLSRSLSFKTKGRRKTLLTVITIAAILLWP